MAFLVSSCVCFRGIIVLFLLVTNYNGIDTSQVSSCGCSIHVLGPFNRDRVVLMCHAYNYGVGDHFHPEYNWTYTEGSNPGVVVIQNSYQAVKFNVTNTAISRNYTCFVQRSIGESPNSCSIQFLATPPDESKKTASVHVVHECSDRTPPDFNPAPTNGVILLKKGEPKFLTCVPKVVPGAESQRNVPLSVELMPLAAGVRRARRNITSRTSASTPTDPHLYPGGTNSTAGEGPSTQGEDTCNFHYEQRGPNSKTIAFTPFEKGCSGIYVCSVGFPYSPRSQSSVVLSYRSATGPPPTHASRPTNRVRIKRAASYFFDNDNSTEGSDDKDSDEEEGHHYSSESANAFDPTGVIIGVSFLILLSGAAVAAAVVWRKRWYFHHRRAIARKISGSQIPLFVSKGQSKATEKSELEEFPRKHIRFLDHIGKGTFGTVVMAETFNLHKQRKAVSLEKWTIVAVKMTLISEKTNEQLKKDFLSELALMKTIPAHTNIITLYASCTAHDPYLMILEYAQHGDLRKYLLEHRTERNYANAAFCAYGVGTKKTGNYYSTDCNLYGAGGNKEKKSENTEPSEKRYSNLPTVECDLITSRDILSFALQICRGLDHLAKNKIVHRDVAARNVLVCEHKIVKISDFGLARHVGQEDVYQRSTKGLLPIRWMSPESLFMNQFSEKSDVWSYGVCLWELITLGSTPYPGLDSTTVLEKIRHRELLICPPHSSTIVNDVVSNCWTEDPLSRPSFSLLGQDLEKLLESEVDYLDLDQINDHEYSTLD